MCGHTLPVRPTVEAAWPAERVAVAAVLLVAPGALRPVVVAPRLAVVATRFVDLRADVAVPFTPAFSAAAIASPRVPSALRPSWSRTLGNREVALTTGSQACLIPPRQLRGHRQQW